MAIQINGAYGEGGGQIFRSAITLSMCTGQAVVIKNIRAGRRKPGLMRQHLAALVAAQTICSAKVEGAYLGSTCVEFSPGKIKAGQYDFSIGSAGSTVLLVQTILPALAMVGEASTVHVQGGTHNSMAPSVDYMRLVLLPLLRHMGMDVVCEFERYGFYPNGGGSWLLHIGGWSPRCLSLMRRGEPTERAAHVLISNLPRHIAERELLRVTKRLNVPLDVSAIDEVSSSGPGNLLSLRFQFANVTELFEVSGALGVSAEQVAGRAVKQANRYLSQSAPVAEYLADQLLIPMVLARGGEFLSMPLSAHAHTNIWLIEQMLGNSLIRLSESAEGSLVSVSEGLALAG